MSTTRFILVRNILLSNAVFSVLSGVVALAGARPLAEIIGLPTAWIPVLIGASVLGFAAFVWWTARTAQINLTLVRVIAWLDAAWVLASWALLLMPGLPLTSEGRWIILVLAEIVAVFAALEFYALWRLRAGDRARVV